MAIGKARDGNLYAGNSHVWFDVGDAALAAMPRQGSLLYKTELAIICMISAMCAVGATQRSTAKKTSFSESELRILANATPDVKTGGNLYSVAMASANDDDRQQAYLKAAAACLIACGKNDVYKKHVKGKLLNAAEVEDEFKDDCQQCSGVGVKERRCYECSGNGRCSKCKGSGKTVSVGFDRHNTTKTCGKCKGNGRCPRCDGECSKKEKCMICMGTGKTFNKTVAARVFHDLCSAIADCMSPVTNSNISKGDAPQKKDTKNTFKMSTAGAAKKFTCGDFRYEIISRGEVYVLGLEVRSQGDSYAIPKEVEYNSRHYDVTGIRYNAFTWRNHLRHLIIADSVRNTETCAFGECFTLEEIAIPNSVTNVRDGAFYKCMKLSM